MTTSHSTGQPTKTRMQALIQTGYGEPAEVLGLGQVEIPAAQPDQVVVRVHSSSVNALDWHFVSGTPYFLRLVAGLRTPKRRIPGADISGTVVATGHGITRWGVGDRVFGEIPGGGFGEYVAVREDLLALAPANISLSESAALGVAALTALQGLRDWGRLRPGQSVLINGASGGVGTFAIQMAKALGADHVTAVCSTGNVEAARELGADVVIDYTKEDFVASSRKFDVIFDNAGNRALSDCRSLLNPEGTLVLVTGEKGKWIAPLPRILAARIRSLSWSQTVANNTASSNPQDLETIREMVLSGKVKPAIERTVTLDEVTGAIAEQGLFHARAKTLVQIEEVA